MEDFTLKFTDDALEDIEAHKKTGNTAALKKIDKLLKELIEHPYTGTGKPEPLKYDFSGCWSRRINQEHRLVYRVNNELIEVIVLFAWGHYDDK